MLKLSIFFIFLSLSLQAEQDKDYLKEAKYWTTRVFEQISAVGCSHSHDTAKTFENIKVSRKINSAGSSSIVYQKAGLIAKGQIVSHTNGGHGVSYYDKTDLKKSLSLSATGYSNLKHGTCDFVKVMKTYHNMPNWLKEKGIMYIQDKNICISAGNNKIYSCNNSDRKYGKNGINPLKGGGYPFDTPILWAVVPRSNGKSNVYSKTKYKHMAC